MHYVLTAVASKRSPPPEQRARHLGPTLGHIEASQGHGLVGPSRANLLRHHPTPNAPTLVMGHP